MVKSFEGGFWNNKWGEVNGIITKDKFIQTVLRERKSLTFRNLLYSFPPNFLLLITCLDDDMKEKIYNYRLQSKTKKVTLETLKYSYRF